MIAAKFLFPNLLCRGITSHGEFARKKRSYAFENVPIAKLSSSESRTFAFFFAAGDDPSFSSKNLVTNVANRDVHGADTLASWTRFNSPNVTFVSDGDFYKSQLRDGGLDDAIPSWHFTSWRWNSTCEHGVIFRDWKVPEREASYRWLSNVHMAVCRLQNNYFRQKRNYFDMLHCPS